MGALIAWVSGTPRRAGPMMATVSSIAAALAPKPSRAPRRSATRARRDPAGERDPEAPVGAARAARNETTATWAGPVAARGPCAHDRSGDGHAAPPRVVAFGRDFPGRCLGAGWSRCRSSAG